MSDTNTDTNNDAINNKKNNNTNEPNVGNFLLYYALGMLGIVLWVLFGTAWLYISKLVTSGIPTDTKYEPYSCDINTELGKNTDGTSIKVPMNSMHELGMKGLAFWQLWSNDSPANKWEQEATFDTQELLDSFNGSFIQEFRDSANIKGTGPAAASGFDKYCSIVLNNVAARGLKWYDTFSLSDKWNDTLKIFVYGMIGLILFPLIWVLNGMCSFYYLIKAAWKQENPDDLNDGGADNILFSNNTLDENESGWSLKYWPKRIGNGFIWMLYWLLIFPILTFFVCPLYATFMPFFKLLWSGSYSLKVDNKFYNTNEQSDTKSFWDFIKDTFAYKRTFLLFLAILNLFTCANTYLGEMYFGAVTLAVILAIVFGDIFVNTAPNDNTMILQQVNNTPKAPKLRRQPIHKGCMFPKEINRIDKTLNKLNGQLTALLQTYESSKLDADAVALIAELKIIGTDLNNEFTAISMSDDKSKVDAFEQKIADTYNNKIEQLKVKIQEAVENQKVIDKINKIIKDISDSIDSITKNLTNNQSQLDKDEYEKNETSSEDFRTQLSNLKTEVSSSNNKADINNLLTKCKKLQEAVTNLNTDLDNQIASSNASARASSNADSIDSSSNSSLDNGAGAGFSSNADTNDISSSSNADSIDSSFNSSLDNDAGAGFTSNADTNDTSSRTSSTNSLNIEPKSTSSSSVDAGAGFTSTKPSLFKKFSDFFSKGSSTSTSPSTNVYPEDDETEEIDSPSSSSHNTDDIVNWIEPRKTTLVKNQQVGEGVINPMSGENIGSANSMMSEKRVENVIAPVNPREKDENIIPVDNDTLNSRITGQGQDQGLDVNTSFNPMSDVNIGSANSMMSEKQVKNVIAPGVNPRNKNINNIPVDNDTLNSRIIGQGGDTSFNPIQSSANLSNKKIVGLSPGILSKDGRHIILTLPGKKQLKLSIDDCIEFKKNGKEQSGKIVGFYKSNLTNNNVDVIFIDLWNEKVNDYTPKVTKFDGKNTNVLDYFITQNNQSQGRIILTGLETQKPEGIALTPIYSANNAYNDSGVWETITHCNVFGEPAQKLFNQNVENTNRIANDFSSQLDREIAAARARNKNQNQGGGSKSKTLKKKQHNIKIRLV